MALVVACALCIMPHRAASQDVGAAYQLVHSGNARIRTLQGSAVELASERAGTVALRMSYRRAMGNHFEAGENEYFRTTTTVSEGGLAADIQVAHERHVDVSVLVGIHLARIANHVRGIAWGGEYHENRETWAPGVGAHVSWYPQPRLPIGIRGTIESASYLGEGGYPGVDAPPDPQRGGFMTVRVGAGIVWAFGRRR